MYLVVTGETLHEPGRDVGLSGRHSVLPFVHVRVLERQVNVIDGVRLRKGGRRLLVRVSAVVL